MPRAKNSGPIVVKKYPNRRLYDTGQSVYVTLQDLRDMVREGVDFVVQDAKTGQDLTAQVLEQAAVDTSGEDGHAGPVLPSGFWRKLIAFRGLPAQGLVSAYLENALDLFISNQERLQAQISKSFDGLKTAERLMQANPVLEELTKQNREMIERTLDVIDPFKALARPPSEAQTSRSSS
ncbi:MAG TPA: polyhydroxyalkanoate synthesis repressor PhaR [Rhodospirillaceae bacterium]|jgi:polyhydroxyalkanoate synthesis repressor PhaR|nr:polyhydroxyalkanoate synthesis repressor PhaR [Alphaproteobacteria bacterium]HBH27156.1 polyhydroxyalkanoate synthesis repressor PhaR [Rhodospirillaceae bacterium]